MELTSRGWRALIFLSALTVFSLAFRDVTSTLIAAFTSTLLLYDFSIARFNAGKIGGLVRLTPRYVELKVKAGGVEEGGLKVESKLKASIRVEPPFKWCQVKPDLIRFGEGRLRLIFNPPLAGDYSREMLNLRVEGPLGITAFTIPVKVGLRVKVYPRLSTAVLRAALYLARHGRGLTGEAPSTQIGKGLEYAGSREKAPGEEAYRLDWKATARFGKLMLKEFHMDAGGTLHLVYDVRAPGPVSRDLLSTAFLNTALGMAQTGLPFGLTIHDGYQALKHLKSASPIEGLKAALTHVLQMAQAQLELMYELLDPWVRVEVQSVLRRLKDEELKHLLKLRLEALERGLHEPYKLILEAAEAPKYKGETPIRVFMVSALTGNPAPILDLAATIKAKGGSLELIQPCQPWLEAPTLEEAYKQQIGYRRLMEALKRRGVSVSEQPFRFKETSLSKDLTMKPHR